MLLSDMISLINANVDDVVDNATAVRWLNAGQNQMAAEAKAVFTQLDATNLNGTFDFPEKYHEVPVLYASAMYQSSESSLGEKNSYLIQFNEGLKTFLETYDTPMSLRDDSNTQQYTATNGQTTFTITKRGYDKYSNLSVYINNIRTNNFYLSGDSDFILTTAATTGQKVTASWEDRPEMSAPPYSWWRAW